MPANVAGRRPAGPPPVAIRILGTGGRRRLFPNPDRVLRPAWNVFDKRERRKYRPIHETLRPAKRRWNTELGIAMRAFSVIRIAVCIFVFICAGETVAWPSWPPNSWQLAWWHILPVTVPTSTDLVWWQSEWLARIGVFVCCPPFYLVLHTDICHHPTYFIYYWIFVAIWMVVIFMLLVIVERLFIQKYGKQAV